MIKSPDLTLCHKTTNLPISLSIVHSCTMHCVLFHRFSWLTLILASRYFEYFSAWERCKLVIRECVYNSSNNLHNTVPREKYYCKLEYRSARIRTTSSLLHSLAHFIQITIRWCPRIFKDFQLLSIYILVCDSHLQARATHLRLLSRQKPPRRYRLRFVCEIPVHVPLAAFPL